MVGLNMMEAELVPVIENPETSIIRLNAETISYLGGSLIEAQDPDVQLEVLEMIKQHSAFVIETSTKIVNRKSGSLRAI
jgi:hypothetical protein|tara:strand:+ start:244 stop:480 length:237 start_codon:yes stop_codon:yes gene_type:complete